MTPYHGTCKYCKRDKKTKKCFLICTNSYCIFTDKTCHFIHSRPLWYYIEIWNEQHDKFITLHLKEPQYTQKKRVEKFFPGKTSFCLVFDYQNQNSVESLIKSCSGDQEILKLWTFRMCGKDEIRNDTLGIMYETALIVPYQYIKEAVLLK